MNRREKLLQGIVDIVLEVASFTFGLMLYTISMAIFATAVWAIWKHI